MFRPVLNAGIVFSPTETAPPVRGLRAVYRVPLLDREHAEVAQFKTGAFGGSIYGLPRGGAGVSGLSAAVQSEAHPR